MSPSGSVTVISFSDVVKSGVALSTTVMEDGRLVLRSGGCMQDEQEKLYNVNVIAEIRTATAFSNFMML